MDWRFLMLSRSTLPALLLVAGIGCSGENSSNVIDDQDGAAGAGAVAGQGGSGAAGPITWRQRCQAVVDHNASCGKSSADAAAVDDCVATAACVPSVWSADVVETVMTCLTGLPCGNPDDDCIAMTESDQTPVKLALITACQDKADACPTSDGCLETTFLISDELASTLADCLDQPCDAASTCALNEYTAAITASGCTGELPFGG
jgi:hypothetical protein